MSNYFQDFITVLESLRKHDVEYILIGGVAVILHGLERLTADLDLFIKLTPVNVEKLREALYSVFQDSSIEEITIDELGKYPVIRFGTPNGFYIDIMTHIGEVVGYNDLDYQVAEYEGVKINIATPETLLKLKRDTIRPKDKVDAMFLNDLIRYRKSRRDQSDQEK